VTITVELKSPYLLRVRLPECRVPEDRAVVPRTIEYSLASDNSRFNVGRPIDHPVYRNQLPTVTPRLKASNSPATMSMAMWK